MDRALQNRDSRNSLLNIELTGGRVTWTIIPMLNWGAPCSFLARVLCPGRSGGGAQKVSRQWAGMFHVPIQDGIGGGVGKRQGGGGRIGGGILGGGRSRQQ